MNRHLSAPASGIALVVTRVILAVVMFAHGYQKMFLQGIGRTTEGFETLNIPLAIVSASFVTVLEVAGSVLLVAGAMTTIVAGLFLFEMVGAAVFVHGKNGIFVQQGGAEYVMIICALVIALAAMGPGRYSVDDLMRRRQRQRRREVELATGAGLGTGVPEPAPAAVPVAFAEPAVRTPVRPGPVVLPQPFAPAPAQADAPITEALPVTPALPVRRPRAAHASSR